MGPCLFYKSKLKKLRQGSWAEKKKARPGASEPRDSVQIMSEDVRHRPDTITTMNSSDTNVPHNTLPSFQPQAPMRNMNKDPADTPLLGGSYKLVKTIGEGAYGVV